MEHLQHFGLSQDPFSNESDLRLYFESPSHRDAQRRVERGLRQQKGLTVLTGEGGMGKTLLARRILDGLEEEIFESTLLVMLPGAADAMGIFARFARQLGAEEPARDRAGVLGQIYERLAIVREDGRHAVLIVDDAQVMAPQVIAELGGLLSLEYEDRRLMSMLLVGSGELDRLLASEGSLLPRVDVRVRLQPLDARSAAAYLMHRLAAVRGRPELIPASTLEALYKFGRGRPRLLNTLADNALFEAYLAGRFAIEPGDVERAAADLGVGMAPVAQASAESHAVAPPRAPSDLASAPALDRPAPNSPRRSAASASPASPARPMARAEAVSGWDAHAVDEIDLDLLAPASPALHPTAAVASAGTRARSAPMPAMAAMPTLASLGPADEDPELDGLFVELIEE